MKRVLQDTTNGLFLKTLDEWTDIVEEAFAFRDTSSAMHFCQVNELANVRVLLRFEQDSREISVGFRNFTSSRKSNVPSRVWGACGESEPNVG